MSPQQPRSVGVGRGGQLIFALAIEASRSLWCPRRALISTDGAQNRTVLSLSQRQQKRRLKCLRPKSGIQIVTRSIHQRVGYAPSSALPAAFPFCDAAKSAGFADERKFQGLVSASMAGSLGVRVWGGGGGCWLRELKQFSRKMMVRAASGRRGSISPYLPNCPEKSDCRCERFS